MFVIYHNDSDGRASAAIIRKKFKRPMIFFEANYQDKIPVEKVLKDQKVFIVDFSLKPEVMTKLLERTSDVTWIDHHKTAMEYNYGIELEGIRDSSKAACVLTWKFFYPQKKLPRALRLIGDYDAWIMNEKDSIAFYEGLNLYDTHPTSWLWDRLFLTEYDLAISGKIYIEDIIKEGEICIRYKKALADDYSESFGWETKFEGYNCFALGIYRIGSPAFGEKMQKYDICISYEYLGDDSWIVSMYSEIVDVGELAKKYKGGGHKSASGFVCKKLPFKKNEIKNA